MRKFIILILILAAIPGSLLLAQNKQVKGTVTNDDGPIAGASVVEKGVPANGTATNAQGVFTITLRGKSNVVIISAVGFAPREVSAATAATLASITLLPVAGSTDDVVVVGFGRQKKITLTGSASAISGTALRQNPSASLQNGLSGRLPGFYSQQRSGRPGADGADFFIRGVSSNVGTNTPLIIVDDIEFSYAQFALIDPNEVESITILKDASTTAVYGIRGANGVVVVTTRRGGIGAPKVSVRTEYATMQPTILPKYVDAAESARLFDVANVNDGNARRFTDADLELFKNGKDPYGHPNIDWYSEIFRKFSHQTRTNLDINGGSDRLKYFVSLGYINQGGSLNDFSVDQGVNNNYFNHRLNYRSNLDIKATNTLDIRVDLYGNLSRVNTPNAFHAGGSVNGNKNDPFYEYNSFYSLSPFAYPIKNPNGSWGYSKWQLTSPGGNYNGNNIIERLTNGGYNRNNIDNMNFVTSANQKLDFITKGLSAKVLVSYASTYSYTRSVTRSNMPSYIYNTADGTYTVRDPNVYTFDKYGLGYVTNATTRELTVQSSLNYDRIFGKHHVYGLALYNRNSRSRPDGNATYNFIPINFQGLTARVGYDFKNKYLLQFNGAYNGTDRFVANKRFGLFPAVSVGYNIAEENFFKKAVPAISQFKIRASYGIVGNDILPSGALYAYQQIYFINATNYNSNATYNTFYSIPSERLTQANFGTSSTLYNNLQEGTLANLDVTWEKEKKLDIGVDFALFKGKISGTVDYFHNNRYDILTQRGTVSQLFGQNLPQVNLGRTENKGYEAEITYRDKIGRDFTYSIRATYSYAKNKILFQDEPSAEYPYQQYTGQSIGQLLIYKWTGTFYRDSADVAKSPVVKVNGPARPGELKYEDINNDGVIDAKDRGFFGKPNLPETNFGFQFGAGYKGINISLAFQGATDFSVSAYEESIRAFSSNLQPIHQQAWTPQLGDNALYPRLTFQRPISDPGNFSTFWYRPGNYLRLRTAEISYNIPKGALSKLKVNDIRVYANGNNLFTWSKVFNLYSIDPEVRSNSDFAPYPPQKVFNIGLSLTF